MNYPKEKDFNLKIVNNVILIFPISVMLVMHVIFYYKSDQQIDYFPSIQNFSLFFSTSRILIPFCIFQICICSFIIYFRDIVFSLSAKNTFFSFSYQIIKCKVYIILTRVSYFIFCIGFILISCFPSSIFPLFITGSLCFYCGAFSYNIFKNLYLRNLRMPVSTMSFIFSCLIPFFAIIYLILYCGFDGGASLSIGNLIGDIGFLVVFFNFFLNQNDIPSFRLRIRDTSVQNVY